MIQKKIKFLITVGSYVPKEMYEHQLILPVGGEPEIMTIEFEVEESKRAMDDAFRELSEKMVGTPYHIWYWWWIE